MLYPVDSIEGPIVKMKDGSVVKVESEQQGKKIKHQVDEIIFLGDMLVPLVNF